MLISFGGLLNNHMTIQELKDQLVQECDQALLDQDLTDEEKKKIASIRAQIIILLS